LPSITSLNQNEEKNATTALISLNDPKQQTPPNLQAQMSNLQRQNSRSFSINATNISNRDPQPSPHASVIAAQSNNPQAQANLLRTQAIANAASMNQQNIANTTMQSVNMSNNVGFSMPGSNNQMLNQNVGPGNGTNPMNGNIFGAIDKEPMPTAASLNDKAVWCEIKDYSEIIGKHASAALNNKMSWEEYVAVSKMSRKLLQAVESLMPQSKNQINNPGLNTSFFFMNTQPTNWTEANSDWLNRFGNENTGFTGSNNTGSQERKRKIDNISPTSTNNNNNMIKNWTTLDANHVANAGFSNGGNSGSGAGTPDDKNKTNKKKRAKNNQNQTLICHSCGVTSTPEWRRGPDGAKTLCNACGLHYSKMLKKQTQNGATSPQSQKRTNSVHMLLNDSVTKLLQASAQRGTVQQTTPQSQNESTSNSNSSNNSPINTPTTPSPMIPEASEDKINLISSPNH